MNEEQNNPSGSAFIGVEGLLHRTSPLLTVHETARYLNVKEQTVRSLARKGKIPALKVGRAWRFRKEDIDTALGR